MSSSDESKPTSVTPQNDDSAAGSSDQAVALIRAKIDNLYSQEPEAEAEFAEAEVVHPRSKHQQFMHELGQSGKTLVEIQTAWHNYYANLPDQEKHEVWQEFYANQAKSAGPVKPLHVVARPHLQPASHSSPPKRKAATTKSEPVAAALNTASELKQQLLTTITHRAGKVSHKRKHQLKSLGFGLSMGLAVTLIMLFGFFNERFIAPFITPSRTVSSTPIITDITSTSPEAVSPNPVIIIPKINIEIPVVYDEPSIDEAAVQRALEKGVLHYPTTAQPGEQGNAVLFGHSSGNILNNGKYKFAFVLLNRLENGDTFMIQKDGRRYIYKVFEKKIVPPTDLSVLNNRDRPTATLITCDPPGTAVNRLVVVGEQISPDPAANVASSVDPAVVATPETLPSESPSLWSRMWSWL